MVISLPYHLLQAAKDPRLEGNTYKIYVVLQAWLSSEEFLPVRMAALAHDFYADAMDQRQIVRWQTQEASRHVRALVALGYLLRGPKVRSQHPLAREWLKTYKMVLPVPRVVTSPTTRAA